MKIERFDSTGELYTAAAEKIVQAADETIARSGRFTFVLSGGSTPRGLYQLLASERFRDRIDWEHTSFFFGDERNVPADHQDSNFRMAHESLFVPLNIEKEKIFRWRTELGPDKAADDYETRITSFFSGFPAFDLTLLGMGADGHTASLFPHSPALHERSRIAVANPVTDLDSTRLTLTVPAINASRQILFLVTGAEKAAALREVVEGARDPERLPAQLIGPASGELFWFLGRNVAELLKRYAI